MIAAAEAIHLHIFDVYSSNLMKMWQFLNFFKYFLFFCAKVVFFYGIIHIFLWYEYNFLQNYTHTIEKFV